MAATISGVQVVSILSCQDLADMLAWEVKRASHVYPCREYAPQERADLEAKLRAEATQDAT